MTTDDLVRNDDAGPALEDIRGERPIGAEAIRAARPGQEVQRFPSRDLEAAFSDAHVDDVWSEIVNCVSDAIEVLDARLEQAGGRAHFIDGLAYAMSDAADRMMEMRGTMAEEARPRPVFVRRSCKRQPTLACN